MTVFLGNHGRILLSRKGGSSMGRFITTVNRADIRENVNRFSVDFAHEQFITGDQIEITTTDRSDLTWIEDPDADESITRFCHVDEAGGIRLYRTFNAAIDGSPATAVSLVQPDESQEVRIRVVNQSDERCLAEVASYSITTNRETIDTTELGAHYRKMYESGLIQGQGQIECFWRHQGGSCDYPETEYDVEFPSYLAKLCIRLVHGAAFHGYFFIYADDENRVDSVWYESEDCIVTNVAVTVEPTQVVRTTIDFVTSGPIVLKQGDLPSFLLDEDDGDRILQENGDRIQLGNPD